ncbi:hypothetical protein CR513_59396, partial [Mucuna pruriens]
MVVDKQVSLAITLRKYKDEILCGVVPMKVTHILVLNRFSFEHMGKKVVLKSLYPKERREIKKIEKVEKAKRKENEKTRERKARVIERGLRKVIKEFGSDIHVKEALDFHIPRTFMPPTNAFSLVPRDLISCANGMYPKRYEDDLQEALDTKKTI